MMNCSEIRTQAACLRADLVFGLMSAASTLISLLVLDVRSVRVVFEWCA